MPQRRRRDRQFDSPNAGGGTGSDNPTPRRRKPAQQPADAPELWDENTVNQEPLPTLRRRSELMPQEGAGITAGNIMATAGPAGAGTGLLSRSASSLAHAGQFAKNAVSAVRGFRPGQTVAATPGRQGFRNLSQVRSDTARLAGQFGKEIAATAARSPLSLTGAAALTGFGIAGSQERDVKPVPGTERPEDEAAVDTASIRERFPHISEGGASLLARMEAGETMRQGDFDEAGFAPENINTVPGGRAFTDRPSIDSLRGLTRQQRGQILTERDRRARFEAGDLSAATPGDLRRMRSAFGANAEATMHRELGGGGERMDRVLHRNRLTPEQQTTNAALLADASQQDAATIREGFGAQQDLQRRDRELDIAQQEADTNRMTTMMRQNPQGQTALNDLITGGLNPETIDQIGQTTFAKIESAFGQTLPPEMRERLGGHLQGFMRHAMERSREQFGGNPTAEQLAGHVQAYTDLFTAGVMASAASASSAQAGQRPMEFLKNMFTRGGGARAAASRGIFNPDNPQETARHLEQMAQGIKALQEGTESEFAVEQRTVRRGGRRDRRVILRDGRGNIVQALNYNEIPPEAQNEIVRAYNQIRGLDRN